MYCYTTHFIIAQKSSLNTYALTYHIYKSLAIPQRNNYQSKKDQFTIEYLVVYGNLTQEIVTSPMDQNTCKNTFLSSSSGILLSIFLHWPNEWFLQKKDNNCKSKGRSQGSWTTYIYNLLGSSFQSFRILGLQIEYSWKYLLEWFSKWDLRSTIWQS